MSRSSTDVMVFPSKVDTWLAIVIGGVPLVAAVIAVMTFAQAGGPPAARGVIVLIALVVALPGWWTLRATDYRIDERTLVVRAGFLRWRIDIDRIASITPTRDPLSSPALSLDRLRIIYDKDGAQRELLVSPEAKAAFIDALRTMNPRISA